MWQWKRSNGNRNIEVQGGRDEPQHHEEEESGGKEPGECDILQSNSNWDRAAQNQDRQGYEKPEQEKLVDPTMNKSVEESSKAAERRGPE